MPALPVLDLDDPQVRIEFLFARQPRLGVGGVDPVLAMNP